MSLEILQDMRESRGQPHEMTRQQISTLREQLNSNFAEFAVAIGRATIYHEPLHREGCELMESWGSMGNRRLMVQWPRSSLKSTILTRTGALWQLCKNPNATVLVLNEKVERVESWFLAIQSIVASSKLFRVLYGDLIPPGIAHGDNRTRPRDWVWSSRKMNFVRTREGIPEPSLTAMGYGSAYTGGHWDWCFFDDMISEEARDSLVVMQAAKDRFDTLQYLGPTPETWNCFIACTRWTFDDLYTYAQEQHGFKLLRRAALENGVSIWEDRWPTESLHAQQEAHPVSFSGQMMNNPMAGKDTSLKSEWARKARLVMGPRQELGIWIEDEAFDPEIGSDEELPEPPQFIALSELNKILLVDPAPTRATDRKTQPNARTAMVMKGIDPWGRRFWLDIWAGRETPEQELRRMFGFLGKWKTDRIGVESVLFSMLYGPFLRYMGPREFNIHPRYVELKPGGRDKDSRIRGKATSFEMGFEYVLETCRPLLMEEYVPYPYGRTRDILDAAAYDEDPGVLTRPETEEDRLYSDAVNEYNQSEESGRDTLTGY